MKKIVIGVVVLFILASAGFGWYYFQGPCGVNPVNIAFESLNDKMEKFEDAYSLASSTSRISLSGPIGDLQTIRRETDDIAVPACLGRTKTLVTGGMANYIDGFIAFMGQESDDKVNSYFVDGDYQFSVALDELRNVRECAPFCKEDPYRATP